MGLAGASRVRSGGKDGTAMLWDVNDGKHLYSLDASSPIQVRAGFGQEMLELLLRIRKHFALWCLESSDCCCLRLLSVAIDPLA